MRRRTALRALGTVFLPLFFAPGLWACPFCAGPDREGNPMREAIFGADFGANLLVTAAPFAVFLLTAALIHFGLPWQGRTASASSEGAEE